MQLPVLKIDGTPSGKEVTLNEEVFGIQPNDHAIYLDVIQYLANQRHGNAKTKELLNITAAIKAGDRKVLYVLPQNSTNIYLSSRNLQQVNVTSVDEISTYTIMNANALVLIDGVQDTLAERNLR